MFTARSSLAAGFSLAGLLLVGLSMSASPQAGRSERIESIRRAAPGMSSDEVDSGNLHQVYGVACTSSSNCWAVGTRLNDSNERQSLIEHWNGAVWSIVPAPAINMSQNYELLGIACLSASDCWAVGDYSAGPDAGTRTLVTHWDGSEWSIVSTPSSGSGFNVLHAVACSSSSDCWAAGYHAGQTLVEHWNGNVWSIVDSPNNGSAGNIFYGVSCSSTSDCWAVGYYSVGIFEYRTLIEHWDGMAWTIMNSWNPDAAVNILYDVKCSSANECWAVGYAGNSTLAQKWNGSSWEVAASPPASGRNLLYSVTCTSTSNCWAVGNGGPGIPLVQHWDGNLWTTVALTNVDSDFGALYDVSCASASDCWAFGVFGHAALIEHWDGNSWAMTPTPPSLARVVSRRTHGGAGSFDVDLPGIECRKPGTNGVYQVVFSFANNLTNVGAVSAGAATVVTSSIGPNPNQYTVDLAAVPNAQYITITLDAVGDIAGSIGNVSTAMGTLVGDTNGSGSVNSSDSALTKSLLGQSVTSLNFRSDVDANGSLNTTDAAIVKSSIGSTLP